MREEFNRRRHNLLPWSGSLAPYVLRGIARSIFYRPRSLLPALRHRGSLLIGPILIGCALNGLSAGSARAAFPAEHQTHALAPRPLVVDATGGGDFTTIRAGYDSLVAAIDCGGTDSLIVRPGFYAETLFVTPSPAGCEEVGLQRKRWIVCRDGPALTVAQGLARMCIEGPSADAKELGGSGSIRVELVGLGIAEPVCLSSSRIRFDNCAFYATFRLVYGGLSFTYLNNCTFYGDVELDPWQAAPLYGCRFVRSRLTVTNWDMWQKFIGCTFEGPIDTAVVAFPGTTDAIWFEDCTFRNCDVAIAVGKPTSDGLRVHRSRFEDIADAAIVSDEARWPSTWPPNQSMRLEVVDSYFRNCGTAVKWGAFRPEPAYLVRDTVSGATGPALVLIGSCTVQDCWIEDAGDSGMVIHATSAAITRNVITGCAGPGLALYLNEGAVGATVASNTIATNLGHGITVVDGSGSQAAELQVRNNLVVLNGGDGIRVEPPASGAMVHNDAWLNYGAAYSGGGGADLNLTADPIFCELSGNNFAVSSVSPCSPSGPYGQIGALGVGCTRLASSPHDLEPDRSFVIPNPARGSVRLRSPWPERGTHFELFDLQGRRFWAATATGESGVSWDGVSEGGVDVGAGLFWVRFTNRGRAELRRLVWLK